MNNIRQKHSYIHMYVLICLNLLSTNIHIYTHKCTSVNNYVWDRQTYSLKVWLRDDGFINGVKSKSPKQSTKLKWVINIERIKYKEIMTRAMARLYLRLIITPATKYILWFKKKKTPLRKGCQICITTWGSKNFYFNGQNDLAST